MEFKELNLHPDLQRGIVEAGYISCMPVQEQVLANAFGGQDLYVQSQTGTGKTAAFLIVIFQRLLAEDLLAGRKALIMVPTRELAVQVEEEAKVLGKYLPFKIGSFYGGVGYTQQEKMLRDNVQVLVGTPGRVLDLNKSGKMNLMDIAFLILDEADRMFDMGFYPDLRKLIKVVPPADRRQTMLFSATLNAWVKNLAWEYTKSPFEIEIMPETVTVDEVEQTLYHVPSDSKMRLLLGILKREKPESAIIFCNTKRYTEIVAKRLRINGYECEFIIGDLPQSRRLKVIDDVKAGIVHFLVATDVAARGLDIDGLSMVVNYDLPIESENYVHRIGRTARAGKTGKAITLASEQDVYELPDIEKYIGKKIPAEISREELYAEDKSAGMRIRSEFFGSGRDDDRRGGFGQRSGRDDRKRGPSREGSRQEGGFHEGNRHGGRDDRQGQRDHREHHNATANAPDQTRAAPGRRGGSGKRDQDESLSALPFEERMAYYKQKYEPPSGQRAPAGRAAGEAVPEGAGGGRGREQDPSRSGGRRRKRGNRPAESGGATGQPGKARTESGPAKRQSPGKDAARPAASPKESGKTADTGAAPKQNILGRFLGIFKKKN
jgi:ATP-dependent RNA helicase RhlB